MAVKEYTYIYRGREVITVEDFISQYDDLFASDSPITAAQFNAFEGDSGKPNYERIIELYTPADRLLFRNNIEFNLPPIIKPNTPLLLPSTNAQIEMFLINGVDQFLEQDVFQVYWSDNYLNLIENDGYVKRDTISISNVDGYDVQLIDENLRVWIWIRAENQIFNVSPFVRNLSTNKGFDVGNFTFELDPVDQLRGTNAYAGNITNYFGIDDTVSDGGRRVFRHAKDFFEKKLQQNDLVFIRYENLLLEEEVLTIQNDFLISSSFLPGRVWDMMGLIDNSTTSYSSMSTDKVINVTGRDLMKLLIDDGTYFLQTVGIEVSGESTLFVVDEEEDYFQRVSTGEFYYFYSKGLKAIPDAIGFIMNHLTNIRIVPNELFSAFARVENADGVVEDQRSKVNQVTGADRNFIETTAVNGIWQIIKVFIDQPSRERRLIDDSFVKPDGSILDYFNKVCQLPFVQFWGDTNGDQFDFIIREPPFNANYFRDIVNRGEAGAAGGTGYIKIARKDTMSYSLNWDQRAYGWYQLQPRNNYLNLSEAASLLLFPSVFLQPFIEIFGNRRLIQADNYFWADSFAAADLLKSRHVNTYARKALNDMKYLIDTNVYLPFTRNGKITLQGDRRIKVGTFVYLEATDELFYVTEVSNDISLTRSGIERTTTVSVERGMILRFINGANINFSDIAIPVEIETTFSQEELKFRASLAAQTGTAIIKDISVTNDPNRISYFDIIDTATATRELLINIVERSRVDVQQKSNATFRINDDVFRAFLERRQLGD